MDSTRAKKILLGLVVAAVAVVLTAGVLLLAGRRSFSVSRGESGFNAMALTAGTAAGMPAYDKSYPMRESADAVTIAPMPPQYATGGQTAAEVDQKIIKNGSLRLTVDHVDGAVDRIAKLASDRKGFVQQSSTSERGDGTHDGSITVRVPSSDFEAAMREIKSFARVVNYESANGQDVTEQYTDLEAQLRNAKAQEEEFLRILKLARNVEEVLQVQAQLGNVRGQIESLQGRLKYLTNVTAFSAINVDLSEETVVSLPSKSFRPAAIIKDAARALVALGQNVVTALIWILIVGGGALVPVAILVVIVVAIIKKKKQ